MSNTQRIEARIPEKSGPYFPNVFGELQKLVYAGNPQRLNEIFAMQVAKKLIRGTKEFGVVTTDRYKWPYAFHFRDLGAYVTVLLPEANDFRKREGLLSARAIALYCNCARTKPAFLNQVVNSAASQFAQVAVDEYNAMYANAIAAEVVA